MDWDALMWVDAVTAASGCAMRAGGQNFGDYCLGAVLLGLMFTIISNLTQSFSSLSLYGVLRHWICFMSLQLVGDKYDTLHSVFERSENTFSSLVHKAEASKL